jgi:Rieske Fe-S protein
VAISRRRFTKLAFLGGLAAAGAGGAGAILNYLYPRGNDRGEPKTVVVAASDVPAPGGSPLLNKEHGFYLVHVSEEDAHQSGANLGPGLLALSRGCPHMDGDCPVVWNAERHQTNPLTGEQVEGWMFCPCHGSVFTAAGIRVFGPSPRSLDAYRVDEDRGRVVVHLDDLTPGGVSSGVEPLPWP